MQAAHHRWDRDRCKDRHDYFLETCLNSDHERVTRGRCLHMAANILNECKQSCKRASNP